MMVSFSPPRPVASKRHFIRFLLISLGIAVSISLQSQRPVATHASHPVVLYAALIALELFLLWFVRIGIRAYGVTLRDLIGTRWGSVWDVVRDLLLALGLVAATLVCTPLLVRLLGPWQSHTDWLLPAGLTERMLWPFVAITAGICEEIVYRGYVQRQLWSWSRSLPLAILVQGILFGAGHIYQGWKPAAVTAVYGCAFGFLAAWRRTLLPGIIAHTVMDMIGGLR